MAGWLFYLFIVMMIVPFGGSAQYNIARNVVINVSLKEFRGICERDYPKIEAYLGLKKYLLRTFGVTLNIHSQKTKGDFDKNTDEP